MDRISQISMYTDAGQWQGGGAVACYLYTADKQVISKNVAKIATMQIGLAELLAGYLGLQLAQGLGCEDGSVQWFLDQKSIVEVFNRRAEFSAEKPHFQNLMCRFGPLTGLLRSVDYVPGHARQRYNEACDKACNWVRFSQHKLVDGANGRNKILEPKYAWRYSDLTAWSLDFAIILPV